MMYTMDEGGIKFGTAKPEMAMCGAAVDANKEGESWSWLVQ